MLRLVDRPVMPSSTPICGRKPATSRRTGDQTTVSFLPRMRRRDLEAPAVRRGAAAPRVAQALERNGHLRREPVLYHPPGGIEEGVPRPVAAGRTEEPPGPAAVAAAAAESAAAAARAENSVGLHAVRVDREHVRPLLIEKRVEIDHERVVARRPIAVRAVRAQHVRVGVVRVEAQIDIGAVVGDEHLRRLGAGRAVERRELHELRDTDRGGPRLVVQPAVDGRRRVDDRRTHRRPPGQHAGAGRDAEPLRAVVEGYAAGDVTGTQRFGPCRPRPPPAVWGPACAARAHPRAAGRRSRLLPRSGRMRGALRLGRVRRCRAVRLSVAENPYGQATRHLTPTARRVEQRDLHKAGTAQPGLTVERGRGRQAWMRPSPSRAQRASASAARGEGVPASACRGFGAQPQVVMGAAPSKSGKDTGAS